MDEKIDALSIDGRTYTCPKCAYSDGFHVSFDTSNGRIKVILICPDCHARFDPGWEISSIKADEFEK